jgi:hypothetical protein
MIVVTTEYRGVFAGDVVDRDDAARTITLANARCCLSWGESTRGWLGLASRGPDGHCRIMGAVPTLQLVGVTSWAECTAQAADNWASEPWAK